MGRGTRIIGGFMTMLGGFIIGALLAFGMALEALGERYDYFNTLEISYYLVGFAIIAIGFVQIYEPLILHKWQLLPKRNVQET